MPQWVKIELNRKPYRDNRGNILSSISGLRNRKGKDEFIGGGHSGYPKIDDSKIMEWHQNGTTVLVKYDITLEKAQSLGGEILSDTTAATIKADVFKVEPKPEMVK